MAATMGRRRGSAAAAACATLLLLASAATAATIAPSRILAFGRNHYFAIPENPVGTVVMFPGCARHSHSYFPTSPACPECAGLPEEVAVTRQALARGYAVLALSNKQYKTMQCWSSGGYFRKNDQTQAMSVIADFLLANAASSGLDRKPLYFFGSSSGATFALKMPQYILRLSDEANRWVCEPVAPARASGRRLLARKQAGEKKGKAAPAPKPKPKPKPKPGPKPAPKPAAKPTPAAAPAPPRGPTPAGMRCKDPFALWGVPDKARLALITRQLAGIVATVSTPDAAGWGVFRPEDPTRLLPGLVYPPVAWVAMANDTWGSAQAPKNAELLKANGVRSAWLSSPSRRVTPTFFSDRIEGITAQQSADLLAGLQRITPPLVDAEGWLAADPKTFDNKYSKWFNWHVKLRAALPWIAGSPRTNVMDIRRSAVLQELNLAYARHENVADYFTAVLMWLEQLRAGVGGPPLSELAVTHVVQRLADLAN